MKTDLILISKLKLLENNPRRITKEQMDKLCRSIENDPKFLECRPVLVNQIYKSTERTKQNEVYQVYAGNQRVRAAKKLGMKEIPCVVECELDEDLMKKRIIQDNKTYGEFDFDALANLWDVELLIECGFKPEELMGDLSNISDDDKLDGNQDGELLEPPKDPKTKYGDVYELGKHRLVCGDSTNKDDVDKVLNGEKPILMVTDPPYGVEYDPIWRSKARQRLGGIGAIGKVKNDTIIDWTLAYSLFTGSIVYVWHASLFTDIVKNNLESCKFKISSQIIWVKQNFPLSGSDYHWKHESCWYAIKKGFNHNWKGDRKQTTTWEIKSLNIFGKSKEEEDERTSHSTQKPIECMARPIRNNTAEGEGVYDPFLGSGTTLIAAEKLNRICYGLEIDPGYCDVIVERWCKLTGKKAKRNGEEIDQL